MRVGRRHRRLVTATLFVMGLGACGGSKSDVGVTPPVLAKSCGSGGTLQLSTLHAATVACSAGTDLTLQGGGASYLIVPQFATGSVVSRSTPYNIGVVGGVVADLAAASGPSLSIAPTITGRVPLLGRRQARQRAFDALLREQGRAMVASGTWRSAARVPTPGAAPSRTSLPDVGSVRAFAVLASANGGAYTTVGARLAYVGDNILLYVDTLAPANGFTAAQLTSFGGLFDKTLFPIDTAAFGLPSDIDQNGHIIMLLTPVVNSLTPSSTCDSDGYIAGFFASGDLSASSSNSNHGEVFYGIVPDPGATASCAHSVAELLLDTPATFLHEFQHMISFSQHVVLHGGPPERTFLDEGMSVVAEELGSLYYEDKFPPPTGRTDPAQIFPDSAEGFIFGPMFDSYEYLLNTPVTSATLHPATGAGVENYGADWLLVRYLGDQKGQAIFKKLEQSNLTGTANIANAAGEPFGSLFGDFSLALYTDSLPGIPKSSIPTRNRYARRNLRQMYARLYATSSGSSFVPRPFPIVVRPLSSTISATMLPGTMTFYRLDTTGQGDVTVRFEASPGVALNELLAPQLSIFRLPPGT